VSDETAIVDHLVNKAQQQKKAPARGTNSQWPSIKNKPAPRPSPKQTPSGKYPAGDIRRIMANHSQSYQISAHAFSSQPTYNVSNSVRACLEGALIDRGANGGVIGE
jgi:hypothetical protein